MPSNIEENLVREDVCVFIFHIITQGRDSEVIESLLKRRGELEQELNYYIRKNAKIREKLRDPFIRVVAVNHGSVEIIAMLSTLGTFVSSYGDLKDGLDQLQIDYEHLMRELLFQEPIKSIFVRWLAVPGVMDFKSKVKHLQKLPLLALGFALFSLVVGLSITVSEKREKSEPASARTIAAVPELREGNVTLLVRCGHCNGSGVCTNGKGGQVCYSCRKAAGVEAGELGIICSVCKGRGFLIPTAILNADHRKWVFALLVFVLSIGALVFTIFRESSYARPRWGLTHADVQLILCACVLMITCLLVIRSFG